MTSLTLVTFAIMIAAAVTRGGYGRALALAGATPIGAALVVGGTAIPTFYMAAIGAFVGAAARLLSRTRDVDSPSAPRVPGAALLIGFGVWSAIVTLLAPQFFAGVEVFNPDGTARRLAAGVLTTSNIAQIVYLVLGIAVVVFLARSDFSGPGLIGIASTVVTLLSFWRFLSQVAGIPFPEGIFDNSPAYSFVEAAPGGQQRFRGIFSEPSGLASSTLVTIAYTLSRAVHVRGWHRVGVLSVAAMAGIMASVSTSATFVVAGIALLALAGVALLAKFLLRSASLSVLAMTAACAAVIASLWVLPIAANMVEEVVDSKVASSSFDERSGADARAYQLALQTFGFGVGLGAHRPSSFFAAVLSATGVVGTALFVGALVTIIGRALPLREYRPVIWGLLALLLTKVVAGPDLNDSSGILWMSLGILAAGIMRSGQEPALGLHARSGPRSLMAPRA